MIKIHMLLSGDNWVARAFTMPLEVIASAKLTKQEAKAIVARYIDEQLGRRNWSFAN